jgi:hypothetical protein
MMAEHRYTIGDLVRVRVRAGMQSVDVGRFSAGINDNQFSGIHEIMGLLPELLNGEPQYQIRSCTDQADHIVRESQLIAPPSPPKLDR